MKIWCIWLLLVARASVEPFFMLWWADVESWQYFVATFFLTFPLASGVGPQKEKNSSWIEDPVQMENSITLKGFCSWNSINVDIMAPKSLKIIELWPLRNFFCCNTISGKNQNTVVEFWRCKYIRKGLWLSHDSWREKRLFLLLSESSFIGWFVCSAAH